MAWAQRYDGVNDYSSIDVNSTGAAPAWNLKSKLLDNTSQTGTFYRIGSGALNNNSNRLIVATDGSRVLFTDSNINADWTGLSIDPEGVIELNVAGGASGIELLVDGVSQGFKRVGSNVSISLAILGENNNIHLGADVEYFNFVTTDDGTLDRLYDATASIHAAGTPILSDISGNAQNATGVNMPTDGSAWVNLGGSGISGAITQTTQSFTQSASGSITSEPITGVISQTASAFAQSATGSAVLNISGVISQTVSAFTQSLSGTVAEQISGTINQTVSSFTMSAVGRVPASWIDKLPANTTWADQTAISTIWTDK